MTHFFFTRIAQAGPLVHKGQRLATPARIKEIISLWLNKASLFYTQQTTPLDFRVVLLYSDVHKDVVREFEYPAWAELSTAAHAGEWILSHPELVGTGATFTRIDADDSYAVDFFEYLKTLENKQERTRVLHKQQIHYSMKSKLLTSVIRYSSPHFATVVLPSVPPLEGTHWASELNGVVGNHASYARFPHIESDKCYCLCRITGKNVFNSFGRTMVGKVQHTTTTELDPRFTGY